EQDAGNENVVDCHGLPPNKHPSKAVKPRQERARVRACCHARESAHAVRRAASVQAQAGDYWIPACAGMTRWVLTINSYRTISGIVRSLEGRFSRASRKRGRPGENT